MLGKNVALFLMGACTGLWAGVCLEAYIKSQEKQDTCVTYNHMLQEKVSEDGSYIVHKEGKTWICTL